MTVRYLLNTSVYSQPLRPRPDKKCQANWDKQGDARLAVPSIVVAELEFGLFLKDSEKFWAAYRSILKGRIQTMNFTPSTATTFAEMRARQQRSGRPADDFDLAIAATAVSHDLTLATLNARHFQLVDGLHWEDWS